MTKTLADFKPPYSAEFHYDPILEHILVLRANGQRSRIFSVKQRGGQGAIDAAWEAAYGSDTQSELDTLREVNAELLAVLKRADEELRMIRMKDTGSVYDVMLRTDISAAIQKAEGRT